MMHPLNRAIAPLALAHIAGGCVLASISRVQTSFDHPCFIALLAMIFADAGMVGIWGALGTSHPMWRLSLMPVLIGCLMVFARMAERLVESEFPIVVPQGPGTVSIQYRHFWPGADPVGFYLVVTLTTLSVFAALCQLRLGRGELRLIRMTGNATTVAGFRFTIRQLLIVTAAVALVLAIGRGTRPLSGQRWESVLAVAIFTPCSVLVALATAWATLGISRPALRLAVVVPSAFVVGMAPSYCLGGSIAAGWLPFIIVWSAIIGLQAAITAGSLLFVRRGGWRLASCQGTITSQNQRLPTAEISIM